MGDDIRILTIAGLDALISELVSRGYRVMGPVARADAIVTGEIHSIADLPRGKGDRQDPARYRLTDRDDDALFGFAAPAQSTKPVFFPAREVVWRGRKDAESQQDAASAAPHTGFTVETADASPEPIALLGSRSCDLRAVEIQDVVLASRRYTDAHYVARRDGTFVVAVACGDPASTCFCASVGTGPRPESGYDLLLTEIIADGVHEFVMEIGTEAGRGVADAIDTTPGTAADHDRAIAVTDAAAASQQRAIDTDGIGDVMRGSAESTRWEDIASRCLACTNCTLVCPTCFCTTVEDVSDLTGANAERHRVWDSCFSENFSYIHGGPLRESTKARYRQWMTHKLGSWQEQFGMLGCVGCGRCIAWCPAGIDITQEAAALRRMVETATI